VDSTDLGTSVLRGEDDLRLLRSLPAECVDLVYLDSPFFSSLVHEGRWADRAEASPPEDRWQGGVQAYLDWIATPLDDLHRILKPSGAVFLVCDEAVGLHVRLLLEELFNQRDARNRMVWWKADSGPAHHYVFYFRKSARTAERNGDLYTVIHREGEDDSSLVAFSFLQGRLRRRVSNRRRA
jgi:site-specific DNA-methyltransferase (adenine-specific)